MSAWIIPAAAGVALLALIIALAWAISANMREGLLFRSGLARRLEELRLQRLMALLGLDPNRYLHAARIVDVERHMRTCKECEETARCDDALDKETPDALAGRCANYRELDIVRRAVKDS
ncbi:hypothetical protein B1C78_17035 [Thioalkalivibrio denitrificans]|uniref:Uncharacterized protein n=1 Tax=Thioalkalivibrio denitrificans TaxID=108003 RepID=A0A1V3N6Q9_9GAMM|nr:hypothetical protein [Thioalkalivibrio denitrificans]OOG20777.1 hypothetical protein B1C78_17035 [Thioalkalivibrio denitrificans]